MTEHQTTPAHYRVTRYFEDFGIGVVQDVLAENLTLDAAEQFAREQERIPGEDFTVEDQLEEGLAGDMSTNIDSQTYGKEISALEFFMHQVSDSYVTDYGDWMREANSFLLQLREGLNEAPPRVRHSLVELQDLVQYRPDWRALSTCRRVLQIAMQMRLELGAPDNLDLHTFHLSESAENADDLTGLPRLDYSQSVTRPAMNPQPEEKN